jgi:hypothetical protein
VPDDPEGLRAVLNYAKVFPEEIEPALAEQSEADFTFLSRLLTRFPNYGGVAVARHQLRFIFPPGK